MVRVREPHEGGEDRDAVPVLPPHRRIRLLSVDPAWAIVKNAWSIHETRTGGRPLYYTSGTLADNRKMPVDKAIITFLRHYIEEAATEEWDAHILAVEDQFLSVNVKTYGQLVSARTAWTTAWLALGQEHYFHIPPTTWQSVITPRQKLRDDIAKAARVYAGTVLHDYWVTRSRHERAPKLSDVSDDEVSAICIGEFAASRLLETENDRRPYLSAQAGHRTHRRRGRRVPR